MVSVYFGLDNKAILSVDILFNNIFEHEWLDDPLVREMIKDIDKSIVLSNQCIQSPVLGQIPPEKLSGGVKTCIMLLKVDDFMPDLIVCGENCMPWLARIFKERDCKVTMSGYDLTFRGLAIEGYCENDGTRIHNFEDWIHKMCSYAGEMENVR